MDGWMEGRVRRLRDSAPREAVASPHFITNFTKLSHEELQTFLFRAVSCQELQLLDAANFRRSSSQRNHRSRLGRCNRIACVDVSSSRAHQAESLHSVACFASLLSGRRTTWPAQPHLQARCVWSHHLIFAPSASIRAARVDRFIQLTQSSPVIRRGPAIRLNISF